MKKLLLFISAVFPFITTAQDLSKENYEESGNFQYNTTYKNTTLYSYTVGFKVMSLEEFPKILEQTESKIRRSMLNGFVLKYNDNQISYRLAASFFDDRITFKNDCNGCGEISGKLNDSHIKLGFEKNMVYGVVQPYFGIDLGFKRSSFEGGTQTATISRSSSSSYDVKTTKNGGSLSPVLGIKFNVLNHLSIVAESTVDVYYSYERQEKTFRDPAIPLSKQHYYRWEYLMKPLGMLSVQYNFGLLY